MITEKQENRILILSLIGLTTLAEIKYNKVMHLNQKIDPKIFNTQIFLVINTISSVRNKVVHPNGNNNNSNLNH